MKKLIHLMEKKLYYGWIIVGLAMISMAFWYGFRTTFSVFFVALLDHFKWSRASVFLIWQVRLRKPQQTEFMSGQ